MRRNEEVTTFTGTEHDVGTLRIGRVKKDTANSVENQTDARRFLTINSAMNEKNLKTPENASYEESEIGSEQQNPAQEEPQKSRHLKDDLSGDNYINVPYSPYEWMKEVKTESTWSSIPPVHRSSGKRYARWRQ